MLSPREVEAQERSYATDDQALLLRIMAKLDSFEVRAERKKSLIHALLDSPRTTALLVLAALRGQADLKSKTEAKGQERAVWA